MVFREEVILALDRYSHTHSVGEQGGFLIGRKQELKSAEKFEVLIERFVPIPQRSGASRLVITQEHYDSVQSALRRSGRGEEIVGWAHMHPGFGVFYPPSTKNSMKGSSRGLAGGLCNGQLICRAGRLPDG